MEGDSNPSGLTYSRFDTSPSATSATAASASSKRVFSDHFHSGRSRESVSQVSSRLISPY
jgi:hypothetical protein